MLTLNESIRGQLRGLFRSGVHRGREERSCEKDMYRGLSLRVMVAGCAKDIAGER